MPVVVHQFDLPLILANKQLLLVAEYHKFVLLFAEPIDKLEFVGLRFEKQLHCIGVQLVIDLQAPPNIVHQEYHQLIAAAWENVSYRE